MSSNKDVANLFLVIVTVCLFSPDCESEYGTVKNKIQIPLKNCQPNINISLKINHIPLLHVTI